MRPHQLVHFILIPEKLTSKNHNYAWSFRSVGKMLESLKKVLESLKKLLESFKKVLESPKKVLESFIKMLESPKKVLECSCHYIPAAAHTGEKFVEFYLRHNGCV